ncbi:hypothetical protein H6F73_22870 [Microcoleus sp. FACHB-68]|nr:hypothetical protein [Microcoleus sp. FACHB-68]
MLQPLNSWQQNFKAGNFVNKGQITIVCRNPFSFWKWVSFIGDLTAKNTILLGFMQGVIPAAIALLSIRD